MYISPSRQLTKFEGVREKSDSPAHRPTFAKWKGRQGGRNPSLWTGGRQMNKGGREGGWLRDNRCFTTMPMQITRAKARGSQLSQPPFNFTLGGLRATRLLLRTAIARAAHSVRDFPRIDALSAGGKNGHKFDPAGFANRELNEGRDFSGRWQ